jgi:hypothetical protein
MADQREEMSIILTQKVKAYDEFQFVTGLIQKAIESDDMAVINNFIDRREELIRHINRLDCRINCYRNSVPFHESPAVIQRIATISEALSKKLKQLLAADHDCTATATNRCEAVRKELIVIRHQEKGLKGYALKMQRMPKFLNVQM